ncbi:DivIVA domain-containing protein [Citricoccus sp. SGAir0253]|uniref:DivIVA domain-containing protein n=1 Tax=Citricoccus sp. SGAir0253 TaxID=2567881 RepID=UPI0010CD5DED|nr:DivIVA domain-containing protein [Citricoccus sp. SGAir0253]QCU77697.1 DivIVA domain-containing protein [Citricoccus sp. SGAir0253]
MSVFVVLVLVAAVVVVGLAALALAGRTGFAAPLAEPLPTLPPVLLPAEPGPADVAAVRFSPGLRGYRMDQVDEVLECLAAALAARDAEIERLRGREDGAVPRPADPGGRGGVISGTAGNPE